MKWVDFRPVPITSIEITDDIRQRIDQAHVLELGASMRDATGGEPGNVPWVREIKHGGYEVVAGRDRIAALIGLKATSAWVRVGQFKPRELLLAEVHENLHRRPDNRDELLARLVETAQASQPDTLTKQTAKAKARAQVAKETGLTAKAVKSAEHRAQVREEASGDAGSSPARGSGTVPGGRTGPPSDPPIVESWGMTVEIGLTADIRTIQLALDEADNKLRAAQAVLTKLGDRPLAAAVRERLHGDIQRAAASVRAARPEALCPWCKGNDAVGEGYVAACLGCRGQRWITAEQMANIPPELRGPEAYAVHGQLLSFVGARAAWAGRPKEAPVNGHAKPKERRIRVLDVDGQEVPPPGDEDAPPVDTEEVPL